MDRFQAMRILTKVAELQSFTRAAEHLELPKSTVTNAVQFLETRAQAKLLNRTTRKVELTTEGLSFVQRCQDVLDDLEDLESMFHPSAGQIRGKLRVDMTSVAARDVVIPKLSQFMDAYPEIEIEIVGADQKTDLIREGIDCAIRSGNVTDPRLNENVIGQMEIVNVASPGYLKRYGTPRKLEDLKHHRIVQYVQSFGAEPESFEYFDGQADREIKMKSIIAVSNIEAYRAAAVAGFGICQNPEPGVRKLLKSGQLVEVLPKFRARPMALKIVMPKRRLPARRVRAFTEWVEPLFRKHLEASVVD